MAEPWVVNEMKNVDLKDVRLSGRLSEVLSQLGGHPTASIPAACGGYAEMTAAYRLFDNEKVHFDNVLQPHIDATRERISQQPVVILPQDTTEIDLTRPHQQVKGAGPLDDGPRRGLFLHLLHSFTPDGTPLGTVGATIWHRDDGPRRPMSERDAERKHTPIEEKESQRWIDTLRQACQAAGEAPDSSFVCVADSEADIYEYMVEAQSQPREAEWIVRACHDRALEGPGPDGTNRTANHLREQLLSSNVLFTHEITIRGREAKVGCEKRARRQPRKSRRAEVEVRASSVRLRAPRRDDRELPAVSVNLVLIQEINPPSDESPVEWILLTSLPIDEVEQVRKVIQYYCVRWMVEVFFRTLKTGCRVEERLFEAVDRFLPCLAVYLIVTWRTLYVCRLGREMPEISCEAVFEAAEWKSVYQVVRRESPPMEPPKLSEMVRMVAQLGGYVNRTRKDEPGPQTVWLGLQRMHDFAVCWLQFGPEAKTRDASVGDV
jgi:hypothetical protein